MLNHMDANTKYKDSVFSFLFSDPDLLRELYCALEGVDLPPDTSKRKKKKEKRRK